MKRFLNKRINTGITLIALVITIVVLIILATVVINLSLGDNGIFNRARTAKEQYQNADTQEQLDIAKATNEIDSMVTSSSRKENEEVSSIILYPNGTKDAPASISKSQRIEVDNPFPGHNLYIRVELLYNNQWGATEFTSHNTTNDALGVIAFQLRSNTTDKIIVQAGNAGVTGVSSITGNAFGITSLSSRITTLPFRLIVICLD